MTWWWWIIVIVLFLAGIVMSVWWAVSVFNFNFQQSSWTKKLKNKTKFNLADQLDLVPNDPGIVLMVIGNKWTDADNFWPFYLFGTDNLNQALSYWMQKIDHDYQNNHDSLIVKYLKDTDQSPQQVDFYVLKKLKNKKKVLKKTQLIIKQNKFNEKSFNGKI